MLAGIRGAAQHRVKAAERGEGSRAQAQHDARGTCLRSAHRKQMLRDDGGVHQAEGKGCSWPGDRQTGVCRAGVEAGRLGCLPGADTAIRCHLPDTHRVWFSRAGPSAPGQVWGSTAVPPTHLP